MSITLIQPGMLAPSVVRLDNFSAVGTPSVNTLLAGNNTWQVNTNTIFDFGYIDLAVDTVTQLLLQITQVDFNSPNIVFNGGTIG